LYVTCIATVVIWEVPERFLSAGFGTHHTMLIHFTLLQPAIKIEESAENRYERRACDEKK
jgi:hypothetical protein